MHTTKKIFGLTILAVFLVGGVYIMTMPKERSVANDTAATPATTQVQTTTTPKTTTTTPKTSTTSGGQTTSGTTAGVYTASQVATHNTASSCWTIVNGNVYNVTSWINSHPGGPEAIRSMCGIDASSAFNDQHGGERRPESILASYKIGVLK